MNPANNQGQAGASASAPQPGNPANADNLNNLSREAHLHYLLDSLENKYPALEQARIVASDAIFDFKTGRITDITIVDRAVETWNTTSDEHSEANDEIAKELSGVLDAAIGHRQPSLCAIALRHLEFNHEHATNELAVQDELMEHVAVKRNDDYILELKERMDRNMGDWELRMFICQLLRRVVDEAAGEGAGEGTGNGA